MFKLMHKKLNKKGFTLAELLVVVAIIAILVAIAVPIFTKNMEQAQIATNEANIRATKAAAVAMILEYWNDPSMSATPNGMKDGIATGYNSWVASGVVEANGDISTVAVMPVNYTVNDLRLAGYIHPNETAINYYFNDTDVLEVAKSGFIAPPYVTTVLILPTDIQGAVDD